MHRKISSAKWQPFCPGQDELICNHSHTGTGHPNYIKRLLSAVTAQFHYICSDIMKKCHQVHNLSYAIIAWSTKCIRSCQWNHRFIFGESEKTWAMKYARPLPNIKMYFLHSFISHQWFQLIFVEQFAYIQNGWRNLTKSLGTSVVRFPWDWRTLSLSM